MSTTAELRGRMKASRGEMPRPLVESVVQEARPIDLLADLWPLARERMADPYIRLLADCLAQARHARYGEGPQEQEQSALDWEEARWMLAELRPSLVLDADANPQQLAGYLARRQREIAPKDAQPTVLIAALDGAPEHRHDCFLKSRNNGRHPEERVKAKDAEFYRQCYHALALYGVQPIDQAGGEPPIPGVRAGEESRLFEDGFVGLFSSGGTRVTALAAALHLHHAFTRYHEERSIPWAERVYARVTVAQSWETAVNALCHTWRGRTRLDPVLWNELTHEEKELILPLDVRPSGLVKA